MASILIGAALILLGVFVPASLLVDSSRAASVDADLREKLLLGATLFRGGLIVLGILIIGLGRMPIWKREVRPSQPRTDPHRRSTWVILGLMLLVAFALRLYRLNDGLWFDEIVTYVSYVRMPFWEILSTYYTQNQHTLYSLMAHASFQIFGESAWALRLPAVLFGVGSVWALYLLGREVSNAREGLLSAALLTFSYHHIWFSQNARGYMGLLFCTILSSWLFLRALREANARLWIMYAITVALGAYALIYMLFVVLAHLIVYVAVLYARRKDVWPNRWAGFLVGFCLAGFLTFQLHALLLPQFFAAFGTVEVVGTIWTHPVWGLLEFVKGMQNNFSGSIVATGALLVFGLGLWSYARTRPALIAFLIIPVVVCIAVKVGMGHHLWPRSLIFAMGFGALVVIRGAMVLGQMITRLFNFGFLKVVPVGSVLCVGLVLVSAMSIPFVYGPKQDYLGALAFVEDQKQPGDSVVTVGLATFPYKYLYKVNWEEAKTLDALNAARSRPSRTWLVYTIPIQLQDAQPEIITSIRRDFKVVKQFPGTLNEGTIFVCQSDTSSTYASNSK